MCNMKGLSFLVWKLWPRLKFLFTPPDTDADADGRAMTLAPRTYLTRLAKNGDGTQEAIHVKLEKFK